MQRSLSILREKWVQLSGLALILIVLVSTISTSALLPTHAAGGNFQPQSSMETQVIGRITNYSGDDQNQYPPNDAIDWSADNGYPTIHTSQTLNSGVGTYANPIDVAINSRTTANGDVPADPHFKIGEKFYILQLHLYFIAEDSCNIDLAHDICTNNNQDTYDGTELHMDLFNNDIKAKDDYQVQQDCENSSGPASGQAQVIANPVAGYPMPAEYPQGTPLFDPVTKTCIGKALWTEYSNASFADLYAHMQTSPQGGPGGVSVAQMPPAETAGGGIQINAGGGDAAPFVADTDFSSGSTANSSNAIDTSGVANPAPQEVYQSNRYGDFTYAIPNLTPNASYTVNLHFAETYWDQTGQRTFDVIMNGQTVLSTFDIIAAAGAPNKAVVKQFTSTADDGGNLTIQFVSINDNAQVNAIEVLGGTAPTATPASTTINAVSNVALGPSPSSSNPDLGPNVFTFDPSMSSATIQSRLDTIFNQQHSNEFSADRYALLFKPGSYNVDVNLGFYTQALGLGLLPDDVSINGPVHVQADWMPDHNATLNFWRGAENMRINPPDADTWAVSQASPMRRVDIRGDMQLSEGGWASGGFLADSNVSGQIQSFSQQQWLSRNDQMGSWSGGSWNMVFVGVNNAPAASFPDPPETVVNQAPVVREKPFLYIDNAGNYQVFVPALRTNAQGTSWANGSPAGSSLPISQFYIAKPGDTADTINSALAQGKNLLFTPGIFHLNDTIRVTRANTVVLGLGLATLIPDNGVIPMTVADVDGVSVAGLLFDAGEVESPILLQVGSTGSAQNHAANPTLLSDVFFRIGGAAVGKAVQTLVINSNNVILDDLWLWRADHGSGVDWTSNTAKNGLIVNGNNVTAYGLFVEHYQQYQVIWNGNGGQTYMLQNELPYDPPGQQAWMNGNLDGYAAYKVADTVTSHEAWGVGSYCFFTDPSIVEAHSFEVPNTPGVKFHDLVSVSGVGTIANIINDAGGSNKVADLVSYP